MLFFFFALLFYSLIAMFLYILIYTTIKSLSHTHINTVIFIGYIILFISQNNSYIVCDEGFDTGIK